MFSFSLTKIQDVERVFQILSRIAKQENLYVSAERGLECFVLSEPTCKSLVYLHLHPDFFDEFQVTQPVQVGIHLTELATDLHQAYQLSHIKLLKMYDSPEGQLVIQGRNPNGVAYKRCISPVPVVTPRMFPFAQIPHEYSLALDIPSKVFCTELKKHEQGKMLTLHYLPAQKQLELHSDKQKGLVSSLETFLALHDENIVKLPGAALPITAQKVHVDAKYLRVMMRFEKVAHVVRVYLATGKPAIFEYIMKLSPTNPLHNSSLQLVIGTTTRERHPLVD